MRGNLLGTWSGGLSIPLELYPWNTACADTFDQYNLQSNAMNLVSIEFQLFTFEFIQVPVDATVSRRDRFW